MNLTKLTKIEQAMARQDAAGKKKTYVPESGQVSRSRSRTYPVTIAGRTKTVTVPDDDRTGELLAEAFHELTILVIGWDQGGRELRPEFVERVRGLVERIAEAGR